jgi:hypothetical protein
MTGRTATAVLPRLLTVVVLVTSGVYLLVYLYRWEWNRALVSGVFFLAAQMALGFSVLFRRLRAIENHLEEASRHEVRALPSMATQRLRATPVDHPNPFAWLAPQEGRLGVFVPVLLGAGVMLSALAYVVERTAQLTAAPGVDRRLSRRLDVLAPPPGGLTDSGPPLLQPPPARRRSRLWPAAGAVLAIGGLVLAIDAIADATQSRPDDSPRPAETVISLVIQHRGEAPSALVAGEALWSSCRPTLVDEQPSRADVVAVADARVDLVLVPGVSELAERRLVGCLADLQIDLIQAAVVP